MECNRCKRLMGRKPMTSKEFKSKFKVGDTIIGYSTNKRMLITAIGIDRFLYTQDNGTKERVAAFKATTWSKQ